MENEDRTIAMAARSDDNPPPAWEPRAVTRARGLAELLVRRPELSGVYSPADVTAEGVRWSA
ncbi:hypothetical protein [Nocardioides sp. YIM 152315]|uniref:hypothetical protein n=1 Tax=Nocardioides sp. YIM 152315 TaxID=3031760 RepID=UPI0023DB7700|nr:hypothetical protein [Nocardioides sp. YIM 152315]MDF1604582.1 hypothetical protein [Nocardioides sp. YIM 152315]